MAQVDNVKPLSPIWPQRPISKVIREKDQSEQRNRQNRNTPSPDEDDDEDGHAVDEYA